MLSNQEEQLEKLNIGGIPYIAELQAGCEPKRHEKYLEKIQSTQYKELLLF